MSSFLADLLPVLILMAIGMIGGKLRFLDETTISGMKRLVASVTLPALLFTAFARTGLEASHLALAGVIFLSCGLMGAVGTLFSRLFKLPRPASVFLFQGFEAGMLGYALFASLFPHIAISRFATADLGQVVYVFTVLMSAMIRPAGEPAAKRSSRAVIFGLIRSPVIIAIVSGMAASALFLGKSEIPWAEGGFLDRSLSMVGNLTTPLVSLIVGFGLSDGFKGGRDIVITTAARLALAAPIGIAIAFGLVPLLGISADYSTAVMVLFLLPPPFVLSIFRKDRKESEFISSVLSLHTVLSLILVAAFAILAPGMLP